jgi:hypothetical protein
VCENPNFKSEREKVRSGNGKRGDVKGRREGKRREIRKIGEVQPTWA